MAGEPPAPRASRAPRGTDAPPGDEVAAVVQRLAVLLSAGVSPTSAWGYLVPGDPGADPVPDRGRQSTAGHATRPGREPGRGRQPRPESRETTTRIIRAAAAAGLRGDSVADAVAHEAGAASGQLGEAWLDLAAAWHVATQAGAPLAACLRDLAASFRDLGQLHRDLAVALAGPSATARMVMLLPLVGILFGALLGFNTLATLFLTLPGVCCLFGGATLMFGASRWNRRLVSRARARDPAPGLELDLMAIAMAGGGSVEGARTLVRGAMARFGRCAVSADPATGDDPVDRVLELSTRAGVPAAELLRSEADQLRRDARSLGERRAEALAVTLMLPLGVCVLPAFMLVGVAPLMLTVLSSTLTGF